MYRSCLLVFFLFVSRIVYGSDNPTVEYLGIERGLSNNTVTCIYRDHLGFMWFGTYDGLNRYDGYSFKVFRNIIGDSTSLRGNHIFTMAGDADHNIWSGGLKGISIYNPIRSEFSSPGYREWNKPALQDIQGAVFVIRSFNGTSILAGSTKGLLVFENNSKTGIHIPLPALKENEGNYSVTAIEIAGS